MNKKAAFTLAEVLITLGIIGVVAALTIPNLLAEHKARRLHSQFVKSYSTIQQVARRMADDNEALDVTAYEGRTFFKIFGNYLSNPTYGYWYTNNVNFNYISGAARYKNLLGNSDISQAYFDDGQILLNDGTLMMFENPTGGSTKVWFFVDLNGINTPPNRLGYDLFAFQVKEGEIIAMGDAKTSFNDIGVYCSLASNSNWNGMACTKRAKDEGINYFKWVVKNIK